MSEWKKNVTREVTVFPAVGVTESLGNTSSVLEIPFDYNHIIFVDSTWFYKETDYQKIKGILAAKIETDLDYIFKITTKQQLIGERLKKYVQALPQKKIPRKDIAEKVLEYHQRMKEFYSFWWIAIPAGEILESQVQNILEKHGKPFPFENLLFVRKELELVREKHERNLLGVECEAFDSFRDLPKELKNKLDRHAKEFGWISTSYHIGAPLTVQDFFKKIKGENNRETIKNSKSEQEKTKNILKTLANDFSPTEQKLILAMQEVIYLRNYQKETVNECQNRSELFLTLVASNLGLDLATLLAFSPTEVSEFSKSVDINKRDLEKTKRRRQDGFAIEYMNGNTTVTEKFGPYLKLVTSNYEESETRELKGSVACRGYVHGKVRVIRKKEEVADFKKGEILVTVMTSIDYIHIMKEASAIITDEGGITCHAAIFSREFNVPCIIGTGNATKLLKTGDSVEVDANQGLVRII